MAFEGIPKEKKLPSGDITSVNGHRKNRKSLRILPEEVVTAKRLFEIHRDPLVVRMKLRACGYPLRSRDAIIHLLRRANVRQRPVSHEYNEEQLCYLQQLRSQGVSYSQAARMFNEKFRPPRPLTKNAVIGKVYRLQKEMPRNERSLPATQLQSPRRREVSVMPGDKEIERVIIDILVERGELK